MEIDSTSQNCCMKCLRSCTQAFVDCMRDFINFVSKSIYCDTTLRNSCMFEAGCGVIDVKDTYDKYFEKLDDTTESLTTMTVLCLSF